MKKAVVIATNRATWLVRLGLLFLVSMWLFLYFVRVGQIIFDPFSSFAHWYWVQIPDFCEHQDPMIRMARQYDRQFIAKWFVQIESRDNENSPVYCQNNRETIYKPKSELITTMKLSDYLGMKCELAPGEYVMQTWRELEDPLRFNEKSNILPSNIFMVRPEDSLGCKE
jgi:hypothetical protein